MGSAPMAYAGGGSNFLGFVCDVDLITNDLDDDATAMTYWESEGVFLYSGFDDLVSITPDGTETFIGDMDHDSKGLAFNKAGSILYSIERADDQLHIVNPANAEVNFLDSVTLTSSLGPIDGGNGLATHPITGELWGILSIDDRFDDRELVKINPITGVTTSVGNLGLRMNGIAFDSTGKLFGTTGSGGEIENGLFSISTTNGSIDFICNNGDDSSGASIALNTDDNFLYVTVAENFSKFNGGDRDGDGVPDLLDNCPDDKNADQLDSDGDKIGDECDAFPNDFDNDGVDDDVDNCPRDPNPDQIDTDKDGEGDACERSSGGGDNQWKTRPTFGLNHENNQPLVENGFSFNDNTFTITDNHHTNFNEQAIEIGVINSFSATVYASKSLKVQEFLFGIPNVGEAQFAELGVEIWYNIDGEIEEFKVVQKSDVIDPDTVSVTHQKTKCAETDVNEDCDTTFLSMVFLEPLKDKVMAIKAIDFKNRDQRTFMNEGFDVSGESLNPMLTKMIPPIKRNEGPIKVTQEAKYSPYWTAEDGRIFEMNSFGSFKEINITFERFQDTGTPYTRLHSGFGGIIAYEQNRALDVFDATVLISELPDSVGYYFQITNRMSDDIKQEMLLQEQIAQKVLDEMDKQQRNH